MRQIQKVSVALTGEQIVTMRTAVSSGEYATTSEIVREALRDWQRKRELHGQDIRRLRELWTEGKQSGPASVADPIRVREKARQRLTKAASRQTTQAH